MMQTAFNLAAQVHRAPSGLCGEPMIVLATLTSLIKQVLSLMGGIQSHTDSKS